MDEWTLNDLLECSVCLERLDTSSKVLPCQHTFCRKCLEEIVSTHKELRCPECRILVDAQIDELPPNVLLMRILEGMKNSGNPIPKKKYLFQKQQQQGVPLNFSQNCINTETHNLVESTKFLPFQKQNNQQPLPYARAIYDYVSKEAGDLNFRKGDYILLHKKVDDQWCQGECEGKIGIFPFSYVQVIFPLSPEVASCRALYDFRMVNDEEEGCLSFKKDQIITVLRRVDDNWGEGKLNDHIGIFPLAFVEMNNVAQALMKLPLGDQPGPSQVSSLTPSAEESTPLIPTDHSITSNTINLHPTNECNALSDKPSVETLGTTRPIVSRRSSTFNSNSATSSSTTTPTSSSVASSNSSSNTSSNSNSAPNSPPRSQPTQTNQNPFTLTLPQNPVKTPPQVSHITNPSNDVLASTEVIAQISQASSANVEHFVDTYCYWVPSQPEASEATPFAKEKRHSFSALTSNAHSNKHSSDLVNSDSQDGQLNRHGSQRQKRTGNDLRLGATGYLALYPYKPQKADELELKKGGLYFVTERCQDGWFKGICLKSQKSGVFPGNYVTMSKSIGASNFRAKDERGTIGGAPPPLQKPMHPQKTLKIGQTYGQLTVPKLPPRASSPSARPHTQRSTIHSPHNSSSTSWVSLQNDLATVPKNISETANSSQSAAGIMTLSSNGKPQSSSSVPSAFFNSTSTSSKSTEKVKDKKEKSGLIKRLTAIKRSKSPTESASYSMDNPVFDDTSAVSHQAQVHGHGHSHNHPMHVRSGSCPSQLIAVKPNDGSNSDVRVSSALVSTRPKNRERHSVGYASSTRGTSRNPENNILPKGVTTTASNHKKSNSLDAADPRKPKQLVPTVRERFRCIVPYPPNSEYELELKVGDIIYVHRKREDGWYKGTQQRTGRTGLFPASFVETY